LIKLRFRNRPNGRIRPPTKIRVQLYKDGAFQGNEFGDRHDPRISFISTSEGEFYDYIDSRIARCGRRGGVELYRVVASVSWIEQKPEYALTNDSSRWITQSFVVNQTRLGSRP